MKLLKKKLCKKNAVKKLLKEFPKKGKSCTYFIRIFHVIHKHILEKKIQRTFQENCQRSPKRDCRSNLRRDKYKYNKRNYRRYLNKIYKEMIKAVAKVIAKEISAWICKRITGKHIIKFLFLFKSFCICIF